MTAYQKAREAFEVYAAKADSPVLQARLACWENINFPNNNPLSPQLGGSEELGELSEAVLSLAAANGRLNHATLKRSQGIRGMEDEAKYREAIADAVADMSIFAMQLCTRIRLDYMALVKETAEEVLARDWSQNPQNGSVVPVQIPEQRLYEPSAIVTIVAECFGVSVKQLLSKSREQPIARARAAAMELVRIRTLLSYPSIARWFKVKDHTTVMSACQRTAVLCAEDRDFFERYTAARARVVDWRAA